MRWFLLPVGLLVAGAWCYAEFGGRPTLAALSGAEAADSMTTRRVWVPGPMHQVHAPALDGSIVAYTDYETHDLGVYDLRTGETRRLTDSPGLRGSASFAYVAVPSPDGRRVAYSFFASAMDEPSSQPGDTVGTVGGEAGLDVRIFDIDANTWRVLIPAEPRTEASGPGADSYVLPADWSPDGRHIAGVATRPDRSTQILLVDVETGSRRVLKSFGWRWDARVSFSPDGRFLAYDLAEEDGKADIYILATDASREHRVTTDPASDRLLGWAPDGRSILYTNDGGASPGLWSVRVTDGRRTGEPTLIREGFWRSGKLGFTRDGRYFYSVQTHRSDVLVVDIDPATYRPVAPPVPVSGEPTGSPAWSPDGRSLAFVGRTRSGRGILIRSAATGETRELAPRLRTFGQLRWSADGLALLARGEDGRGRQGLYRIDAQTGAASLLLRMGGFSRGHAWSPDGSVVFHDSRQNDAAIVAHHLAGGAVDTLHTSDRSSDMVHHLNLSPDGSTLVMTTYFGDAVRLLPSAGGEPRDLIRAAEGETLGGTTWSHDGAWILYTRERGGRSELWRVPAAGGTPERIAIDPPRIRSAWVHPSGTRLALLTGRMGSEVWVLENIPGIAGASR